LSCAAARKKPRIKQAEVVTYTCDTSVVITAFGKISGQHYCTIQSREEVSEEGSTSEAGLLGLTGRFQPYLLE